MVYTDTETNITFETEYFIVEYNTEVTRLHVRESGTLIYTIDLIAGQNEEDVIDLCRYMFNLGKNMNKESD